MADDQIKSVWIAYIALLLGIGHSAVGHFGEVLLLTEVNLYLLNLFPKLADFLIPPVDLLLKLITTFLSK